MAALEWSFDSLTILSLDLQDTVQTAYYEVPCLGCGLSAQGSYLSEWNIHLYTA